MKNFAMLLAAGALASASYAGVWAEQGDAGNLVGNHQETVGVGSLDRISGILGAGVIIGDVDMYCIRITDPANFSASVRNNATFDSQLFLFDANGNGIAMNDDASSGGLQSWLPAGDALYANLPAGEYLLAISPYDNDAIDSAGDEIFPDSFFGPTVGPFPGAGPINDWNGDAFNDGGEYAIDLTGCTYCVPAPGALALLGMGGLVVGRRRR